MKGDWEMFQLKNINGAYLDLDLLKPMLTYGNMLQWYFEDEQKHTKWKHNVLTDNMVCHIKGNKE